MNRIQLLRNTGTQLNVGLLHNKLVGKKLLIINEDPGRIDVDLHQYFDVIITAIPTLLNNTMVDIFIDTRNSPYSNSILDFNIYNSNKDTLFLLNDKLLYVLNKSRSRLNNYILSYGTIQSEATTIPGLVSGVEFGLAANNLATHIAMIGGATDVYVLGTGTYGKNVNFNQLLDHTKQVNKYGMPDNLRSKDRQHFIYTW